MTDNIVTFPGFSFKRGRTNPLSSEPQEEAPEKVYWRSREHIKDDIEKMWRLGKPTEKRLRGR
jgi:hypothetical protein